MPASSNDLILDSKGKLTGSLLSTGVKGESQAFSLPWNALLSSYTNEYPSLFFLRILQSSVRTRKLVFMNTHTIHASTHPVLLTSPGQRVDDHPFPSVGIQGWVLHDWITFMRYGNGSSPVFLSCRGPHSAWKPKQLLRVSVLSFPWENSSCAYTCGILSWTINPWCLCTLWFNDV